jgi:hypothetical protein
LYWPIPFGKGSLVPPSLAFLLEVILIKVNAVYLQQVRLNTQIYSLNEASPDRDSEDG